MEEWKGIIEYKTQKQIEYGQKKMVAPQRPSANYNPMNISLARTKDTV